ncbi:DUF4397 domain-containing protein [Ferrimonas sp. SCSIO 43195]|uniref:DUF4397 domain-containing protein n=1 Tax=Ferrimonas sp. SCSIO 43195 TaxID=2822844 RepID=UPI002075F303|nr:DUF4397 domain-containing protein [Ferrimonas sp. SCSIO 43195]USD38327.1 DUF4397 domain-containing protein [Ferrimonas sp. SCSIO 43195]
MKALLKATLVASSCLLIVACDDDDDDPVVITPPELTMSYVRVIHASPDAPKVNVLVDGNAVLSDVDYQQASTLLPLPSGSHNIKVEGILADGSTATVFDQTLTLDPNIEYNVTATGLVASLLAGSGPTPFAPVIVPRNLLSEDLTMLRLQVLHSAPAVGRVGVHVTGADDPLSAATELTELSFGEFTPDPVMVEPGTYRVRLTDPDDPSVVAYDSGALALTDAADLFIAAVANTQAGAAPVNLLVADNSADEAGNDAAIIQDSQLMAGLRATHGIAAVGGVDIWVNGQAPDAASPLYNLTFANTTPAQGFLSLDADSYQIQVAANATSTVLIDIPELTLAAGTAYSAIAVIDAMGMPTLWAVEEDLRAIATEARLRVFHASASAGKVDIYLSADMMADDGDIKLAGVPYLVESGILGIPPGNYYLLITPENTPEVIAVGPAMLELQTGMRYTAIAVDDPNNTTGLATPGIDIGVITLDGLAP